MKTAIDFYFFVNLKSDNSSFSSVFSFTELATNSGHLKDTELFYSLHEQPGVIIDAISTGLGVQFQPCRDNDQIGIIVMVEKSAYEKWNK